ncbi:MAG TPA: hypothetical protein ACFE0H_09305 [Elainellaceae cyanobacterium]
MTHMTLIDSTEAWRSLTNVCTVYSSTAIAQLANSLQYVSFVSQSGQSILLYECEHPNQQLFLY